MFEHEHPLNLVDMLLEHTNYEEESDEDDDEKDLVTKQDFECQCDRCGEKIHWYHRYYYNCEQCHYSMHKFCAELPETMEHAFHVGHTYTFTLTLRREYFWSCQICQTRYDYPCLRYHSSECYSNVDIKCATKWLRINIIHHPSHIHPLASIAGGKQILCECGACGKEHKGMFYQCVICPSSPSIHIDCAFLSKKLFIQQTTNDLFSHPHSLTLAYSFHKEDQRDEYEHRCRVCNVYFDIYTRKSLVIYKCDKCRYYVHLDCAIYRGEPFMSILTPPGRGKLIKNYEDEEYSNLLQLPFPDETYSLLKQLFSKEIGLMTLETNDVIQTQKHNIHEHPLVLVDVTGPTAFPKVKKVSYHNPMKKIQVLCNGCVKPITNPPFYMCANEDENCNFVLHEWCTRLPARLNDHPGHPQDPLVYYSKIPSGVLGVFFCAICRLPCNGFVYCCLKCQYFVDVCCAFIPEKVTHNAHQNHLLSRVETTHIFASCHLCQCLIYYYHKFGFSCNDCNIHLHIICALLVTETIRHKYDKHPMKLSYFPIENHKSEYFCEICEEKLDPNRSFYHCHDCVQSVHSVCAPSILQSETYPPSSSSSEIVNKFVNIKFGGIHKVVHIHQHPLSFVQGIQSDGQCNSCRGEMQYEMILKCLECNFAIHFDCFKYNLEGTPDPRIIFKGYSSTSPTRFINAE